MMKALVFDGEIKSVVDYPVPEPVEGEALIKVLVAGICNTDIEITKGYLGFKGVLGHEFTGLVERINGGDQKLLGRRVVGRINCGCGLCHYCVSGLENHCPQRTVLGISGRDGAFAEYLVLPVANLLEVPEKITDEEAVFTEPLAAAFRITEQLQIRPSERILVLGDGKLGILVSLVLNLTQAELTLAGKYEQKLGIASAQGVRTAFVHELKIRKEYDVVVDATGSADGFSLALNLVRPGGTIVLKSTIAGKWERDLSDLVIDEINVIGSRCGPFEPALRLLSKGMIKVRPMITGIFRFEEIYDAFEAAVEKGSLKVMIDFR
jgi:threonine dehydrogenase-like Zn-dependent dehydrogenase